MRRVLPLLRNSLALPKYPFNRAMASSNAHAPASKSGKLIFAPGEAPSDAHSPSSTTQNDTTSSSAPRAAQFSVGTLHRKDLSTDPFSQFHDWFTHPALRSVVPETVTLSTASLPSGRVSSRMVYLKELDARGFVVYSNWGTSGKAADVESNPSASLCFWWKPLERQVRVEGRTERLTDEESQVYFDTRARGSRIGAWASRQTDVLKPKGGLLGVDGSGSGSGGSDGGDRKEDGDEDDGRAQLEEQVKEIEQRFEGQETIPVPPFWGGLRVIPDMIEFWQGRDSRLHDRFRYTKQKDGQWLIERLNP